MKAKVNSDQIGVYPVLDGTGLWTESDVEQKLLYPFLSHPAFLGIPTDWIRTKEYMSPTEIDKVAGKRRGYIPDYSIWNSGLPLVIVEAKGPDISVEQGLREARLYAGEINKRYPPKVNPIRFILVSNGIQISISEWDSEQTTITAPSTDFAVSSSLLSVVKDVLGRAALDERLSELRPHFEARKFWQISAFMGERSPVSEQLGVNEFAAPLFPVLNKYFSNQSEEVSDEIIDRAYVTSDQTASYGAMLDVYLKDRTRRLSGNQLQPIVTGRNTEHGFSEELSKFAQNPQFFGRVQLVVGAVGAGKSTFIRRYFRRLMPRDLASKTHWAFINFNVTPPGPEALRTYIAERFIASFNDSAEVDVHEYSTLLKIFSVELNRFENGANKPLKKLNNVLFEEKKAALLDALTRDLPKFAEAVARHFAGERGRGIVVVFDNVDKRDRDDQLRIFEAAQWFKELARALVVVMLRDTTFQAYRDEPPLDAFINSVNFYIRTPQFAQIIRKRLELTLESMPDEVEKTQHYMLESGQRIQYPASRLGEFLMSIYVSLFAARSMQMSAALEALVARDARRALGMFADLMVSPHLPTNQITGVALGAGRTTFPEHLMIKALMRGRYKFYNSAGKYVHNLLGFPNSMSRPSNFIFADIIEMMQRVRKLKVDFQQEGYLLCSTVVKKMAQLGYDEGDSFIALGELVRLGMVEPESLVLERISFDDAVRLHASGYIHTHYFLRKAEYLIAITSNSAVSSRDTAVQIGAVWGEQGYAADITMTRKARILELLTANLRDEYNRRCRRHAFYDELGFGGRHLLACCEKASQDFAQLAAGGKHARR